MDPTVAPELNFKRATDKLVEDPLFNFSPEEEMMVSQYENLLQETIVPNALKIGREEREHLKQLKERYYLRRGRQLFNKDLREEYLKDKAATIAKIREADAEVIMNRKFTPAENIRLLWTYDYIGYNPELIGRVMNKTPGAVLARLTKLRRSFIDIRHK